MLLPHSETAPLLKSLRSKLSQNAASPWCSLSAHPTTRHHPGAKYLYTSAATSSPEAEMIATLSGILSPKRPCTELPSNSRSFASWTGKQKSERCLMPAKRSPRSMMRSYPLSAAQSPSHQETRAGTRWSCTAILRYKARGQKGRLFSTKTDFSSALFDTTLQMTRESALPNFYSAVYPTAMKIPYDHKTKSADNKRTGRNETGTPTNKTGHHTGFTTEQPKEDATPSLKGPACGMRSLKPQEIVTMLNDHIIGQGDAKRAVANALRNRWRRQQINNVELRDDILPKNILMIGPTGVGKTEIARRMAKIIDAPFIKVEATKYTEVGFHGRDVDTIIKDLVELAIRRQYMRLEAEFFPQAQRVADEKILRVLAGQASIEADKEMYQSLQRGCFDNQTITLDLPYSLSPGLYSTDPSSSNLNECCPNSDFSFFSFNLPTAGASSWSPGSSPNLGSATGNGNTAWKFSGYSSSQGKERIEKRTMTIKEARVALCHIEFGRMMGSVAKSRITQQALESVEQEGIVFVDEIDKICSSKSHSYSGPDASAEGVQRDLLPLIEGTTVSTRYGAFHSVKPSDMMAELQGRLPVRVELKPLTEEDFRQILCTTRNNLVEQNTALLATEGVTLLFERSAILEIARSAYEVNSFVENIGARRLITIIEKVMEEISFIAPDMDAGSLVRVTDDVVRRAVEPLTTKGDLHKFIL